MFTSNKAKLKAAAFALRGDINLARSEAVTRNKDVLIQFVFNVSESSFVNGSGDRDGYRICVDGDTGTANNSCGDADDTSIRDMRMKPEVQFYDTTGGAITGGPTTTSGGSSLVNKDGVLFTSNKFKMQADGTSNLAGTAVIYVPETGDPTTMLVEPFAVVVNSTGRVRLERWRTDDWYDK
ncbi:MAG: GspH/FimT family pseudopilin [Desulfobacterales bacterium]|nr:GspH/FimT family pseudopilin [Desulfobacterales bacterium]